MKVVTVVSAGLSGAGAYIRLSFVQKRFCKSFQKKSRL